MVQTQEGSDRGGFSGSELASKRVVVMGLGRFGGGVGVTRYLVSRGAEVLVTDLLGAEQLQGSLERLKGLPVVYRLGEHNVSDFTTADLIVVNPAVDPRQNRFLRVAEAAGVPQTSEIRLLLAALPNRKRVVGVTGTGGKSTTTAMIGHILGRCVTGGRVFVGGNLGGSLLEQVDAITARDWVVLELSSFMLEGIGLDRWSPHVAVITNLSSNHLDRHGDMASYAAAKQVILEFQAPDDRAVLGAGLEDWFRPVARRVYRIVPASAPGLAPGSFGPNPRASQNTPQKGALCPAEPDLLFETPRLPLLVPGEHNQLNAAMAIEAAVCCGVERGAAAWAVCSFAGLPHRLELVAQGGGVRFFNDSKSTTPEAAMLAIRSVLPVGDEAGGGPGVDPGVHVILGGYDKQSDLTEMAQFAARTCRGVYTIGATGATIAEAAESFCQAHPEARAAGCVLSCGTLERAMRTIFERVAPGDTVLLSPGCASWDQFENFEKRGGAFVELARQYAGSS